MAKTKYTIRCRKAAHTSLATYHAVAWDYLTRGGPTLIASSKGKTRAEALRALRALIKTWDLAKAAC